ncbi:MAG: prefoldin subunit, partial [Candidatus Thermoplasmatota archaeon]|nr:prefoldin subunit [Candidatus Thermoplasmatota archaeon]
NMSDMEQFQIVVSEIQSIRQQMAGLNAQIIELTATSDAVTNQPKDLALHQQLGGVLIEVADRDALIKVLDNDIKTLTQHLDRLQSREGELIDSYEELKKVLEGSN